MEANVRLVETEEPAGLPAVGARRREIVRAAGELFGQRGYHGTSMQDIGQRVGLLKGSLYAHVANKEEILLELVSTVARRFLAALEPVIHGPESPPEKLRLALRAHVRVLTEHLAPATVFLHEWRHLEGQPARWIREERARYEAIWRGIFAAGVADGSFRPDLDLRFATQLALSAANWTYQWFDPGEGLDAATIADRFADLLLGGCLALPAARCGANGAVLPQSLSNLST